MPVLFLKTASISPM